MHVSAVCTRSKNSAKLDILVTYGNQKSLNQVCEWQEYRCLQRLKHETPLETRTQKQFYRQQ